MVYQSQSFNKLLPAPIQDLTQDERFSNLEQTVYDDIMRRLRTDINSVYNELPADYKSAGSREVTRDVICKTYATYILDSKWRTDQIDDLLDNSYNYMIENSEIELLKDFIYNRLETNGHICNMIEDKFAIYADSEYFVMVDLISTTLKSLIEATSCPKEFLFDCIIARINKSLPIHSFDKRRLELELSQILAKVIAFVEPDKGPINSWTFDGLCAMAEKKFNTNSKKDSSNLLGLINKYLKDLEMDLNQENLISSEFFHESMILRLSLLENLASYNSYNVLKKLAAVQKEIDNFMRDIENIASDTIVMPEVAPPEVLAPRRNPNIIRPDSIQVDCDFTTPTAREEMPAPATVPPAVAPPITGDWVFDTLCEGDFYLYADFRSRLGNLENRLAGGESGIYYAFVEKHFAPTVFDLICEMRDNSQKITCTDDINLFITHLEVCLRSK